MATKYYTNGYQQSAQSAGYTSIDQVRALQSDLNKKGAGLTVDGVWGPATDSAYKKYMTGAASTSTDYLAQLRDLLNARQSETYENPYAKTLMELITPKSDEAYRQQAEAALTGDVNRQLETLAQDLETRQQSYENNKREAQQQAEASRQQLEADYAQARSDLETAALRRGMGRSSYLTDNLAYLARQQAGDQAAVDAQLSETLGDISEAQLMAQQHYQQTAQRLQQDLADDLTAYEAALRDKDRQAALSAYESLMAAYDTYRRYRQQDMLELMTTLYEATLQKETAAAKASSSSGKSSSASSQKTATPTTRKKQSAKKSSSGSYYDDSWLYMNHPSGM